MIDSDLRGYFQATFNLAAIPLVKLGVHPDIVTAGGLLAGLSVPLFMAMKLRWYALLFLISSGLLDIIDGTVARSMNRTTNRGAAFDIFCDRCVESAVCLGIYLRDPDLAAYSLAMIISILLCVTSFLVVGIFQQEKDSTKKDIKKSFFYDWGLMERTEAFIFFGLIIVFGNQTRILASTFTVLVAFTAMWRMVTFYFIGHV